MAYSSTHTEARPKAPSKQTQHCWPATPNIIGCCKRVASVYTLGPVPCCCVLLGVVAQSLKLVKLLATCKQTQQLTNNVGICCVRLHIA